MRFTVAIAACCCWLALPVSCALAQGEAAHLGDIHVDQQDSKAGIRVSLKPSGNKIVASPEAMKIMNELMTTNGVDQQPAAAWHIELAYDEFDEDGDNVHSGKIEEFYVNSKTYRKVIKTDDFSQKEAANGSDLYRVGDQSWPTSAPLRTCRNAG